MPAFGRLPECRLRVIASASGCRYLGAVGRDDPQRAVAGRGTRLVFSAWPSTAASLPDCLLHAGSRALRHRHRPRSARPPALPRSRRRAHNMDLPHMRPDRVRAAPQFSLHHARRAGDRANLQHDIALPGAYAARAAPVSSAHPGCLDAVTVLSRFDPASQKKRSITDETTVFRDELPRQPVLGDRQARRPQ